MSEVKFRNWTCRVEQGRYSNGRVALQLVDAEVLTAYENPTKSK